MHLEHSHPQLLTTRPRCAGPGRCWKFTAERLGSGFVRSRPGAGPPLKPWAMLRPALSPAPCSGLHFRAMVSLILLTRTRGGTITLVSRLRCHIYGFQEGGLEELALD